MTKNTPEEMQELVETRLQELIRCAHISAATDIKLLPGGIEITVDGIVTTPLIRTAISLQECYPDGGIYVTVASRLGKLVLGVYYIMED